MKTSTEIGSIEKHVGQERAVELVAKAGFDAFDFSMFSMRFLDTPHPLNLPNALAHARRLKQIASDNGIVCNQSHAPFPVREAQVYSRLKEAIEYTAEAGGKICIIHPDNYKTAEQNAEMYFELLPFAKGCGVKIATENMWGWNKETDRASFAACATAEDFLAHLNAVSDDDFVACLDLGHAEMMGDGTSAPQMIRALGSKLQALHIHDNDRWHDSHQIPFSMQIDFDAIVKTLKEIGYSGYLTLEADQYLSTYTSENVFEGVKKLYESVDRLRKMFN
jgi:sugar phosphate isomerase/epimerase